MSTEHQTEQGGAKVRLPPPLVFVGFIVVGLLLQWLVWPLGLRLELAPRLVVGQLLVAAGVGLGGWSTVRFRRTGQDPAPWKPSPSLILDGPYRFSRNPIYTGMTLVQLGVGISAGNGWIVLLAPLALLIVHVTAVLPEEAYLGERFGESYLRYKESVRRYL